MPKKRQSWNRSINENPPSEKEVIRQLYDEFAEDYDETLASWNYQAPDIAANYLSRLVPFHAPVLDAGCGTGLTGAALVRAGYTQITGSDLSPVSVDQAIKSQHYENVHVLNLSEPLPFAEGQFGGVICIGVFSYIPDLAPTLRELLRITAPGGALVFTQREDIYKKNNNARLFDELYTGGQFDRIMETEPKPYLPGHPDFAGHIGVQYFVWQKRA